MIRRAVQIEAALERWARVRRQLLGIDAPTQASEYLGSMCSTLRALREDRDGAGQSVVRQRFPEVYTGESAEVNRAWRYLLLSSELRRRQQAMVLDAYYSYNGIVARKARALGLSRHEFYDLLDEGRRFIDGWLSGAHAD